MKGRLLYAALGFGAGILVSFAVDALLGKSVGNFSVGVAIGSSAAAAGLAQRYGRVKTLDEINKPLTLFPLK